MMSLLQNIGMVAVKTNEKIPEMSRRHSDDNSLKSRNGEYQKQESNSLGVDILLEQCRHQAGGTSFKNPSCENNNEETSNREIDMVLEQDGKAQANKSLHYRHRTDGDCLYPQKPIPYIEEKLLPAEAMEQHPQHSMGTDGREIEKQSGTICEEASVDKTTESEKVNDEKATGTTSPIRGNMSDDETMDFKKFDRCNEYEKHTSTTSPIHSETAVDETMDCDEIVYCNNNEKEISMKSDKESEKETVKNNIETPSVDNVDCNIIHEFNEKKEDSQEDTAVAIKEAPRLPQDYDTTYTNCEATTQKIAESDQTFPGEDKRGSGPTRSFTTGFHGLSLHDNSAVSTLQNAKNDEVSSLYPLDGRWEMIWQFHPANTTVFVVKKHIFQMFDHSCEIILSESPSGNSCANFQWPKTITSDATPVFQKSEMGISLSATSIEWTTSDEQYGKITWKRLNSTECKAEVRNEQSNNTAPLYPLDGNWVLTWKSYHLDSSLIVVQKHKFEMFDSPCEIKLGPTDNFCPSFKWPGLVTSFETPVFQTCQISVPPDMETTEWPNTIEWTITDPQYGKATWTKLSDISERKRKILDAEDNESIKKRKEEEELRMKSSIPGKALNLVKEAMRVSSQIEDINTIAEDDIVYLAERLLMTQKDFKDRNVPWRVDIAYHHTQSINLKTIKTNGLLSRQEREDRNICSKFNGIAHGEGIYCSQDPVRFANQRYGDTTILLARMKGTESRDSRSNDCNTILRNGFCVLKYCNQCVPLFQFQSKLLGNHRRYGRLEIDDVHFREKLGNFHQLVQAILDQILNDHVATNVKLPWAYPPFSPGYNALSYTNAVTPETISYIAPDSLATADDKDFCQPCLTHKQLVSGCPMCIDSLTTKGKVVQIAKCGHIFHSECLKKSMENKPYCPVCSVPISREHWRGTMPSGSMTITQVSSNCTGFFWDETTVIHYVIPSDIQKKYHPKPGLPFHSDGYFTAYIPASPEGKKLVIRLKFAFSRGLTFSVLAGTNNLVVWNINHKSSQTAPSYPDASYISRCNVELDRLHVPTAIQLSPTLYAGSVQVFGRTIYPTF